MQKICRIFCLQETPPTVWGNSFFKSFETEYWVKTLRRNTF